MYIAYEYEMNDGKEEVVKYFKKCETEREAVRTILEEVFPNVEKVRLLAYAWPVRHWRYDDEKGEPVITLDEIYKNDFESYDFEDYRFFKLAKLIN